MALGKNHAKLQKLTFRAEQVGSPIKKGFLCDEFHKAIVYIVGTLVEFAALEHICFIMMPSDNHKKQRSPVWPTFKQIGDYIKAKFLQHLGEARKSSIQTVTFTRLDRFTGDSTMDQDEFWKLAVSRTFQWHELNSTTLGD